MRYNVLITELNSGFCNLWTELGLLFLTPHEHPRFFSFSNSEVFKSNIHLKLYKQCHPETMVYQDYTLTSLVLEYGDK